MTDVPFFTLQRQHEAIRTELDAALAAVLDRGLFVLGAAVEEFESGFAAWCGAAHAVGVGSGTDALELALRAVGVGPGDEVITAAATCVPTVAAIESTGATPVLADIDEATATLDAAAVEPLLTDRTRALVPVHLYGQCADVDALRELVGPRKIAVVEDAAQAHGARLRGRPAGSLADAAAFSFYPTKNLGALGDGGAVVTGDAEIAERVRMLRSYGERARYVSELHGRNSRLDELQAAALTVKLRHVGEWNARRRALALLYTERLAGTALGLPVETADRVHAWHLYVVRSPRRDELRAALADEGIGTLVHYPRAVHEHPAYRALGHSALRRSERLAAEALSLPLYPELTDDEAERVAGVLAKLTR
jgi:dTDP-3-amino-3,4,6-trideoxy-alpha-D-glucose transaminase